MGKRNIPVLPPSEAGDAFCKADQAIRAFTKSHKRPLTSEEHEELGELLRQRARKMSDLLGIHVASIADK